MTEYFRHIHSDQWYRATEVKKRREIETPWGPAMAEVGTIILTLKGNPKHKVICTQADLDAMTSDPVPEPPTPGEPVMDEPSIGEEQILPGMKHYGA